MLVLVLESSTSSAKALLYDDARGVVATESRAYPLSISAGGKADTDAVFTLTMELGRQLAAGKDIHAVALCGIWHSIALLDERMNPSGGTFAWNYMEPAALCRETRKDKVLSAQLYERTGCMPHVTYMRDALAYLVSEGVDLKQKRFLSQGAYHFMRLTGEDSESICTASGSGLLNIHSLDYDELALSRAGITAGQLGKPVRYNDTALLTKEGAQLLGIAPDIPVVPAHADGAMNQLAACGSAPDGMSISVGTSGAVRMSVREPVLPKGRQLFCYYGATTHISGAAVAGATNCVEWFRKMLLAETSFEELERGAGRIEGAPLFLPFLYGERCPGWDDERMGGFLQLRPEHTAKDMYLALQAGVLFNLRQCYDVLIKSAGVPHTVHLSGGILHSTRWTQMAADILGTSIRCAREPNASALGTAMLAMAAVSGNEIAAVSDSEVEREIEPNPKMARIYERQYEAYLDAYARGFESDLASRG